MSDLLRFAYFFQAKDCCWGNQLLKRRATYVSNSLRICFDKGVKKGFFDGTYQLPSPRLHTHMRLLNFGWALSRKLACFVKKRESFYSPFSTLSRLLLHKCKKIQRRERGRRCNSYFSCWVKYDPHPSAI